MQVYLSEHIAPSAYARLARHFEIVDNFDHPEQLAAMIIRRAVVPRAVIARAPNLKVIAMHGVSRDTIDTAAAAGLTERCEDDGVIIPNYLTPPLRQNTEYYYFTNQPDGFVLFKADGDQDRPNLPCD